MSNTALAEGPKKELRHTASSPVTPMQMLQTAVEQGADIDKLEKLMQLQERWESNEARKAWNQAMNALKANPPHVTKNRQVGYGSKGGRTEYKHASLDHMADAVSEAMSPHGLSFRWETKQENGEITVTCIVSHKDGHSERTTLSAGADNSGGKNSIQAVGSAVTYLERYTLKAAIGIAEEDQDDDALSANRQPVEKVSREQAHQITARLEETDSDRDRFLRALAPKINARSLESIEDIPASQFDMAMQLIENVAKRKAQQAQS